MDVTAETLVAMLCEVEAEDLIDYADLPAQEFDEFQIPGRILASNERLRQILPD